ncbi:MAG: efflux RND transporter periplasmic adaptor subunit, partial [Candidatus Aminicenantes bacterium]|nr:efflux RND transporter periplasmic adaptor subunit [Candidatus Aminicenantes bacterium]
YLLALNNYEKLSSSPYESVRDGAEKMLLLARERLAFWDIPEEEIEMIEKTGKARRTLLLRSLMTGFFTHKAVVEGDKVGPGMDLFHIADLSKIWVEAAVYESELPFIEVGQSAELELDHIKSEKLKGKIDFIYPYLDQKSRTNNIRLVFDNPGLLLKPDMYVTVRISSHAASDALAIPSEAVIHSGTREIVFVTKGDGKFEPREVKIGQESDDGYTQVLSGLFDDEEVVVSGQFLLDSESRTREAIAKMRASQTRKIEGPSEEAELYTCPMHPDFLTTDKNARCPECGMTLEKVKKK